MEKTSNHSYIFFILYLRISYNPFKWLFQATSRENRNNLSILRTKPVSDCRFMTQASNLPNNYKVFIGVQLFHLSDSNILNLSMTAYFGEKSGFPCMNIYLVKHIYHLYYTTSCSDIWPFFPDANLLRLLSPCSAPFINRLRKQSQNRIFDYLHINRRCISPGRCGYTSSHG